MGDDRAIGFCAADDKAYAVETWRQSGDSQSVEHTDGESGGGSRAGVAKLGIPNSAWQTCVESSQRHIRRHVARTTQRPARSTARPRSESHLLQSWRTRFGAGGTVALSRTHP